MTLTLNIFTNVEGHLEKFERSLSELSNPVPIHDKNKTIPYNSTEILLSYTISPPATKCYVTPLPSVIQAETLLAYLLATYFRSIMKRM